MHDYRGILRQPVHRHDLPNQYHRDSDQFLHGGDGRRFDNYTTTTCTGGGGGTPNTLADVAEYYYVTDLRDNSLGNCTGALVPHIHVCQDDVPHAGLDAQSQQHMTTFTLGWALEARWCIRHRP